MTQPVSRSSDSAASPTRAAQNVETSWWAHALIGLALVLAGVYVIANAVAATIATVALLGIVLLRYRRDEASILDRARAGGEDI